MKAGRGGQPAGALVLIALRLRHEIGDGEIEHAAGPGCQQEAQHRLRQVAQQEPAGHRGDEERQADEAGPFHDLAAVILLGLFLAQKLADAQCLADIVDEHAQADHQRGAGADRGADADGDAFDQLLRARRARQHRDLPAQGRAAAMEGVDRPFLIGSAAGDHAAIDVELDAIDQTKAQDEAADGHADGCMSDRFGQHLETERAEQDAGGEADRDRQEQAGRAHQNRDETGRRRGESGRTRDREDEEELVVHGLLQGRTAKPAVLLPDGLSMNGRRLSPEARTRQFWFRCGKSFLRRWRSARGRNKDSMPGLARRLSFQMGEN
jgi:hypothetical protein